MKTRRPKGLEGFSLVEVTLALGIASFVVLALLGLTGASMRSMGDSSRKLEAASVASEISARWRSTLKWNSNPNSTNFAQSAADFPIPLTIPAAGAGTRASDILVDAQGMVTAVPARQKFRLAYVLTRPALNPMAVQLNVRLSWPPDATEPVNSYEVLTSTLLGEAGR